MALERAPEEYTTPLSREQYNGAYNLIFRRMFYKNAVPPIDFLENVPNHLSLKGDETILDVGCSSGDVLINLHEVHGHQGKLIGVDIDEAHFVTSYKEPAVKEGHVQLRVGEAQHLPMEDSSVDVLLALFLLYHVPNLEASLAEFKRVLKPGGQILVATSSEQNKPVHRSIEQSLAVLLITSPPPIFIEPFDDKVAAEVLPHWFDDIEHHSLRGEVHLTPEDPSSHANYKFSLQSMMPSFGRHIRYGQEWTPLIDDYVEPRICLIENFKGRFVDEYDLHYFTGRNNKPQAIPESL